ncbi:TVP38/TMEM64 family protein [Modestobacter muralis]|uniref:TVP38/TMEM64 family membrane protein n=1 Tax=Modestobacter muralis TaxID=1608614 RepID=A0A6P0ERG9_9ACTN|nr:TVP38/TMEM64 family protein [Modestobacter muralis]NEN50163.1 TVP38/TMEM64 family protein [Modestobacter muralis]
MTLLTLVGVGVLVAVGIAWRGGVPSLAAVQGHFQAPGVGDWLLAWAAVAVILVFPSPRSALALAAGAVFGVPAGLPLVLTAALAGGIGGFTASRRLGRGRVQHASGKRLARVDELLSRHGVLAVLAARLLPAPPFAVVSYAAGVSGIGLVPFAVGTALGAIPGSVFYVSIGAAASTTDGWWAGLLDRPWLVGLTGLTVAAVAMAWWIHRQRRPAHPGGARETA